MAKLYTDPVNSDAKENVGEDKWDGDGGGGNNDEDDRVNGDVSDDLDNEDDSFVCVEDEFVSSSGQTELVGTGS